MTSLGQQTWFRSADRSLEGWVHRPDDDRAVGAIVIAGPFAHEALVTYRALRVLAIEAARRGFVALRFSWSGTGDSEPAPEGADLAAAWQEDLAAAVELARAASGFADVQAVGLRFGAAVVAAAPLELHKKVLWAPLGGRAFLRMQSSLLTMHLPADFPRTENGLELCGYTLDDGEAASLRSLPTPRTVAPDDASDGGSVVLEEDPAASDALFQREPSYARVAPDSIERVLDALDRLPEHPLPQWRPDRELVSVDPVGGTRVRQTLVDLGPDALPGILTEPLDTASATTAALFIPFSNDAKGVDRIARATSMRLAESGVMTLRADRLGIGDAADPRDHSEVPTFTHQAVRDVALFATWLAERSGRPVVGIGLCSGAWLVARAAGIAPFERLVMVNNLAWSTSTRGYDDDLDAEAPRRFSERSSLAQRVKNLIKTHAPYQLRFRVFAPIGHGEIAESLLAEVPEHTGVRLLFGTGGDQRVWEAARGPEATTRLARGGRRVSVELDRRTDHALMSAAALESYLELLDREFTAS